VRSVTQGKINAKSVMETAVMRARRLMRRAFVRSCSIKLSSSMASSPSSMLRVPRAAIAIQVFSRACINPNPPIQMGKKIMRRSKRGASMTTNVNAAATPIVKATTPSSRRLRCSRAPMLIVSEFIEFRSATLGAKSRQRLPGCDALPDLCANRAHRPGGRSARGHHLLGRRGCRGGC
jgi:hypothetical protein